MILAVGGALLGAPRGASAAPADDAAGRVARLETSLKKLRADKASLSRTHRTQTSEVAALKAQRSSWSRDRKLRASLSRARTTANRLAALDRSVRDQSQRLEKARKALVVAVDIELAAAPTASRRARLAAWKRRAQAALRPPARRIVLPDQRIDPLADATELGAQARLIAQTEKQLVREEQQLERREQRYRRIARLQRQRRRASEADLFDDDRTRRTTGRVGDATLNAGGGDASDDGGTAGDPAPAPPGAPEGDSDAPGPAPAPDPQTPGDVPETEGGGGGGEVDRAGGDPAVVLADVVDADTISALRRAERSNDPVAKAEAAARARAQVAARRRRLQQVREQIRRRINEMSR